MAQGLLVGDGVLFATQLAAVLAVLAVNSLLGTGSGLNDILVSYFTSVIMTSCGNLNLLGQNDTATLALVMCLCTSLSAGGILALDGDNIVAQGLLVGDNVLFATQLATILTVLAVNSLLGAGSGLNDILVSYPTTIVMTVCT